MVILYHSEVQNNSTEYIPDNDVKFLNSFPRIDAKFRILENKWALSEATTPNSSYTQALAVFSTTFNLRNFFYSIFCKCDSVSKFNHEDSYPKEKRA